MGRVDECSAVCGIVAEIDFSSVGLEDIDADEAEGVGSLSHGARCVFGDDVLLGRVEVPIQ